MKIAYFLEEGGLGIISRHKDFLQSEIRCVILFCDTQ